MSITEINPDVYAIARDISERDVASMPWLPQLPEVWAQDLHDRIEYAERRLIAPNLLHDEYKAGTAKTDDEIHIIQQIAENGSAGTLFTAEHASNPLSLKTGKLRNDPDTGTAGLVAVLAEDYGTGIIMTGRQTSNVPSDPDHPIKPTIIQSLPKSNGFVAVHGMARGKFMAQTDRTEIQATLGLGADPTDVMHDFAEKIVGHGKDMGLYVTIANDGEYFVQKPNSHEIKRNSDGTPYRNRLAALGQFTTTNFVRGELQERGLVMPALQIELTRFLRITPLDVEPVRDRITRVIGIALGYKLLERIVELSKLDLRKIPRSQGESARAKTVLSEGEVPEGTSREEKLFAAEVSRSGDEGALRQVQ